MKKLLLSIVSIGLFISSNAQEAGGLGLEFGFRGAAASNWLFNSNVSNGGTQSLAPAFSYNYGFDFGFDISDKVCIEVNLLFGTINQGYSGKFGTAEYIPESLPGGAFQFVQPTESYVSNTTVHVLGIPLLGRFGSGNGAYIEVGPEYQIVQSAGYSATFTDAPATSVNYSNADVSSAFAKSNIQGVLGFGDDFQIGSTGLNIVTALRFYYGFTDLKGVDGHGQDMNTNLTADVNSVSGHYAAGHTNDPIYKDIYGGTPGPYYSGYKATHAAGVSFSLGLYYWIGLGGKSGHGACKHAPKVRS